MLFRTPSSVEHRLKDKLNLGDDVTAAAGPRPTSAAAVHFLKIARDEAAKRALRSSALWCANRPLSPLFRGSILVYLPGFTLLMGWYFVGPNTGNTSRNRFNINNLKAEPGSHFAVFVFQISRSGRDIRAGAKFQSMDRV